jgi:hypothetical protein
MEFASRPCILRNQYPWDEEILVEDWAVKVGSEHKSVREYEIHDRNGKYNETGEGWIKANDFRKETNSINVMYNNVFWYLFSFTLFVINL